VPDLDEGLVYDLSLQLSDRGFGSFERCQQVVKACKGDIKEAEKVLSKIMVKEFK
jgi:exonuclease VII small subunit